MEFFKLTAKLCTCCFSQAYPTSLFSHPKRNPYLLWGLHQTPIQSWKLSLGPTCLNFWLHSGWKWLGEELRWYLCLPKTQWRKQVLYSCWIQMNSKILVEVGGTRAEIKAAKPLLSDVYVHLSALWFPFSSQAVIFTSPLHSPSLIPGWLFVVLETIWCGKNYWVCRQVIEWEHAKTSFSGHQPTPWTRRGVCLLSLSKVWFVTQKEQSKKSGWEEQKTEGWAVRK